VTWRVLRYQPTVFGPVAATATAWRMLDAVDDAALARVRDARAQARERAWLLRADAGRDLPLPACTAGGRDWPGPVLDVDATVVKCHSDKKSAAPPQPGGSLSSWWHAVLPMLGDTCAVTMLLDSGASPEGNTTEGSTVGMQNSMSEGTQPLFLFSLPRTGSTLLQRVLGSHAQIATASEPWFMLPFVYSLRETGVNAEYEHGTMARGVQGFSKEYLPDGTDDYLSEIRALGLRLYGKVGKGHRYFLDKTPRYHHIAADLIALFPEGRFIFLWRHPVAVAASMMQTFADGRWNLHRFSADLFSGLTTLIEAYEAYADRACAVRYEDLLQKPEVELRRLLSYLELEFDPNLLTSFTELEMRNPDYWDPTGTMNYRTISREPLQKWKHTMANPIRKAWGLRYLRWIGSQRLATMGYDLDPMLAEVAAIPASAEHVPSDVFQNVRGLILRSLRGRLLQSSLPMWPRA
jgi:hypothetical protein